MNFKGQNIKYIKILVLFIISIIIYAGSAFAVANQENHKEVTLTPEETEYIKNLGVVKMCVDPDWYPYEHINEEGLHKGIAADLIALISQRTGLKIELVPTKDWNESLSYSKERKCDILSLLNETHERSKWMIFTNPYYIDSNVIITREEHDYVSDVSRLTNETVVLPEGTSIEEKVRKDYPNLKIVLVDSEDKAIEYVSEKKANLTIRSLTMGAYVIKSQGFFNLKIAGQIPSYTNQLKIGVDKNKPILRDILNKGIATITPEEVQQAINSHISIKIQEGFDYKLFFVIFGIFSAVIIIGLIWNFQLRTLNKKLDSRQAELTALSEKLFHQQEKYRLLANELEVKNKILNERATNDKLTGIRNRYYFEQHIFEKMEQQDLSYFPMSLLSFDLDKFKNVNDTYGHDVGDKVLVRVAETVQRLMRKTDIFARWGGEEFVILMYHTDLESAQIEAEKIRQSVENIDHEGVGKVTISIGIAERKTKESFEAWFKRTDQAMYMAKESGRNRVCISHKEDLGVNITIGWKSSWECGKKEIDSQHKELLSIGNKLIENIFNNTTDIDLITELDRLISHISVHFQAEEKIISELKFDDLENHIKLHKELLEKARNLKAEILSNKVKPGDAVEFIVNTIIIGHLIKEDTKFFKLMK